MSPSGTKVDAITDFLRQRITEGEFGTAGRLPSLRMLAERFNTTHETMNKVIQQLQAEGLLISYGRAGVFVNHDRTRVAGIAPRFDLLLEQRGLTSVETDIYKPSIVPASAEVARALDVNEGSPVVQRFRRQGTSSARYRLAKNFYPVELAGGEILEQMQQDVHFDVLAAIREVHQKEIKRVQEDVLARLPTSEEQEMLNIVRNTPVFEILRTSRTDDDGIVIMYSRIIAVSHYFVLSYDYVPYWLKE